MEQNKNPTSPLPKEEKSRKPMTEATRQKRKKMLIYPLMGLLFAGSMWLIFAPSKKDKAAEQQGTGFNTEMPQPSDAGIIGDKRTAYERARMEEKQKERMHSMQDLSSLFQSEEKEADEWREAETPVMRSYGSSGSARPRETIRSSASAYEDINRTLGNFYETPKEDPEKEELRARLEELEERLLEQPSVQSTMDEQIALLEKSYELAAKYMPGGQTGQPSQPIAEATEQETKSRNGKALAKPVGQLSEQVVSALSQPMSDAEFMATYSQERNYAFHTAIGNPMATDKNTIEACVHGNQTITDGQSVRFRLLEGMRVAHVIVPRNTVVIGSARVQGERLSIQINSLEYAGTIIPVDLSVYDGDGQEGIFIPNSLEVNAVKEVAANMGSSLGSSINISTDAGAQLASDLGKGVIQGTSQYISKKMRIVKVHLKAGYRVMLYQKTN